MAGIVDDDTPVVVLEQQGRYRGLADSRAADWNGDWQCPEVAPVRKP
jgi:hypothetical protein